MIPLKELQSADSSQLRLVNRVAVDTRWGVRWFDLLHGDITRLPVDGRVDLLTLSVFPGKYQFGHMLGALRREFGLELGDLRKVAAIDATQAFGCWLSPLLPPQFPFARVLVDETLGTHEHPISDVLRNIFAFTTALEVKGIPTRSLVMPLLGSGALGIDPSQVVDPLLEESLAFLERARTVEVVRFVEIHQARIEGLSKAMDSRLNRVAVSLPATAHLQQICKDIGDLAEAYTREKGVHGAVLQELAGVVRDSANVSSQLFAASRRLAEAVVADLHGARRADAVLWKGIDGLCALGYAPWLASYLHILRVQGNETVHYHPKDLGRCPAHLVQADLELCLTVVQRVLRLWLVERG